jgi:DNA-binding SARP family transcriptional activator/Tfp pilus assembly protein PilF
VPDARTPHDAGVGLAIDLLGTPSVWRDGVPASPPRGKKAWGLLAYLLLADRRPRREELAGLLFAEADDPLGALRWNLAELRRLLPEARISGSPVRIDLPPDAVVDTDALTAGTWLGSLDLPGLGRELLEGLDFRDSPAFEVWLLARRRHLQAQAEDLLHEAALAKLAEGQGERAIDLAARLVALNPFDENFQELLVRAYAANGDREGAARQLAACVDLFRRELGVEPGPTVYAAAEATGLSATVTAVTGPAAARAQLDAGEAAIGAGAVDAGLECLRRAAAEAHACGDLELKARALLALGRALAHAARGRDEEASAALHEAIAIASRIERGDLSAEAHRELAWIEILRARFGRAIARVEAAIAADGPTPFDDGLRGAALYQQGRYGEALDLFRGALDRAGDDRRIATLALGEIAVIHVVRGELAQAREALERTLERARALAWNAYLPYPEALLGIVEIGEGRHGQAEERLGHAFALGCQIRDCCWEGIAAAGLALLEEARGDLDPALERFDDARRRSVREPDAWLWGHAFVLDLACAFAVRHGLEPASGWVHDLEALAARTMMRGFLARAYLYRSDLGEPATLASAAMLAAEVDDPALSRAIERRRVGASVSSRSSPH